MRLNGQTTTGDTDHLKTATSTMEVDESPVVDKTAQAIKDSKESHPVKCNGDSSLKNGESTKDSKDGKSDDPICNGGIHSNGGSENGECSPSGKDLNEKIENSEHSNEAMEVDNDKVENSSLCDGKSVGDEKSGKSSPTNEIDLTEDSNGVVSKDDEAGSKKKKGTNKDEAEDKKDRTTVSVTSTSTNGNKPCEADSVEKEVKAEKSEDKSVERVKKDSKDKTGSECKVSDDAAGKNASSEIVEESEKISSKYNLLGDEDDTEDMRPMAKLLYGIGLSLSRQNIYRDLIRVQNKKQAKNQLNENEVKELNSLKSSYDELLIKNDEYRLDVISCEHCGFKTESANVLEWHKEFAHGQEEGNYICSFCDFETRQPGNFFFHMEAEHNRRGRIYMKQAFFTCSLCPFENNSKANLSKHHIKCDKNFQMKRNLEPSPTDCDIPLKKPKKVPPPPSKILPPKPAPSKPVPRPSAPSPVPMRGQQPTTRPNLQKPGTTPVQSQAAARPMYNLPNANMAGLRMPMMNQSQLQNNLFLLGGQSQFFMQPGVHYPMMPGMPAQSQANNNMVRTRPPSAVQQPPPIRPSSQTVAQQLAAQVTQRIINETMATGTKPGKKDGNPQFEICEICGGFVKDRESLRVHFYWAHKVDIHKDIFDRKQPHLTCEFCTQRFWTYQGVARHRQLHHAKQNAGGGPANPRKFFRCSLCGAANITNLLNHLSVVHKITTDTLLKQKKCLICGVENAKGVELHILTSHADVFKAIKGPTTPSPLKGPSGNPTPTGLFENAAAKKHASPQGSKQKKFEPVCSICNLTFQTLEAFSAHCNKYHIHKCHRCGQKWSSPELLKEHFDQVHRDTSEPCQICNEKIHIGRPYIRHMRSFHLKECSVVLMRLPKDKFEMYMRKQKDRDAARLAAKKAHQAIMNEPVVIELNDDEEEAPAAAVKSSAAKPMDPKPAKRVSDSAPVPKTQDRSDKEQEKQPNKSEGMSEEGMKPTAEVMEVDGDVFIIQTNEDDDDDDEDDDKSKD